MHMDYNFQYASSSQAFAFVPFEFSAAIATPAITAPAAPTTIAGTIKAPVAPMD